MRFEDAGLSSLCLRIADGTHGTHERVSDGVPLLSAKNVRDGSLQVEDGESKISVDEDRSIDRVDCFKAGDVLLTIVGSIGRSTVLETGRPLAFQRSVASLRPRQMLDSQFLCWSLQSQVLQDQLANSARQSAQAGVYLADVAALRVPVPPVEEQQRIADFLDDQVARIDEIIRLREEQVGAVQSRHEVVLRNLVCSGADDRQGDGALIPWLGRVRGDWQVGNLGQVAKLFGGTTFPHDYQGHTIGDLPFVKVADFAQADRRYRLGTAKNRISLATGRVLGAKVVPTGSVVFARVGAALLLNQRRLTTCEVVVDDNVRGLHPIGDPAYCLHVMRLLDFGQMANPGPVPTVAEPQIRSIPIPVPPIDVQAQIGSQLDEVLERTSVLADETQRTVALLQERKRSLITAAVTGQFDVTTASGRGVA